MQTIDKFDGEYRWLSNFWPCAISFNGLVFSSLEAAYVAAKTDDPTEIMYINTLTPGQAKKYGRTLELRPDWDEVKVYAMLFLLRKKFKKGSDLAKMLDATGDAELIEGNTWGDTFWGVCNGIGENNLGKLLMQVREENRYA